MASPSAISSRNFEKKEANAILRMHRINVASVDKLRGVFSVLRRTTAAIKLDQNVDLYEVGSKCQSYGVRSTISTALVVMSTCTFLRKDLDMSSKRRVLLISSFRNYSYSHMLVQADNRSCANCSRRLSMSMAYTLRVVDSLTVFDYKCLYPVSDIQAISSRIYRLELRIRRTRAEA